MGSVPLALSVHKFISSVGADAGFAALIAVAILVLLYFAHARETAGLRAHIDALLERVSELETALARVAANQARLQPAPPPSGFRAPAGAQAAQAAQGAHGQAPAAAGGGRAPALPAAASAASRLAALELPPGPPAGVAAPALSSATRVIPAAVAARIAAARVAVTAGAVTAGAGGGEPPHERAAESPAPATALAAVATPPPSTAAGGLAGAPPATNGASHNSAPVPIPAAAPAPATAGAAVREAPQQPGGSPPPVRASGGPSAPRQSGGRPAPAGGSTPGRAGTAAAGRRAASRPSSVPYERAPSRFPRALLVALAVLIVAAVVVAAVVLSQSGGGSHTSASTGSGKKTSQQHRTTAARTTRVNPANVTVAVLNGTTIAGLAHKVSAKLVPPFREGTVGDASQTGRTTTVVAFLPGHRADALAVAHALGLSAASVQAVDSGSETVACSGATPCTTDVVVIVGSDLASL